MSARQRPFQPNTFQLGMPAIPSIPDFSSFENPYEAANLAYQQNVMRDLGALRQAAGYEDSTTGQRVGGSWAYRHPIATAALGALGGAALGGVVTGDGRNAATLGALAPLMLLAAERNRRAQIAGKVDDYTKARMEEYKNIYMPQVEAAASANALQGFVGGLPDDQANLTNRFRQDTIPTNAFVPAQMSNMGMPEPSNPGLGTLDTSEQPLQAGATYQKRLAGPGYASAMNIPRQLPPVLAQAMMNNYQQMAKNAAEEARLGSLIPSQILQNMGQANASNASAFDNTQSGLNRRAERPFIAPLRKSEISEKQANANARNASATESIASAKLKNRTNPNLRSGFAPLPTLTSEMARLYQAGAFGTPGTPDAMRAYAVMLKASGQQGPSETIEYDQDGNVKGRKVTTRSSSVGGSMPLTTKGQAYLNKLQGVNR